jgi:ERCC4-related helicase
MDASTMASLIVFATNAIDREKAARKAMAAAMTDMTQDIEPYKIRKVMEAAAEALPYRQLLEDTETVGMEAALRTLRKRLTRQLLTYSTSNSTCPLTNEAERLKWDSHRAFLVQTEVLDD